MRSDVIELLTAMKAYRRALIKANDKVPENFILNIDGMIDELNDDIFVIEILMGDD